MADLDVIKFNPPASKEAIEYSSINLGIKFPEDLVVFYKKSNGGEGSLGEKGYIQLWRVEDLAKFNADLNTQESLPNTFLFASNGGGTNYGYRYKDGEGCYFSVDPISMQEDCFYGGKTLNELLDKVSCGTFERMEF